MYEYICTQNKTKHFFLKFQTNLGLKCNDDKIRGVNLGGWLVLEEWMTPTLFKDFQSRYGGYSLVKLRVDYTAVSFVLPTVDMLIILVILRVDM